MSNMDNAELRIIIREELEKMFSKYTLAISYDINKTDKEIGDAIYEKLKELGGVEKNQSLYCFKKHDDSQNIINELNKIISENSRPDNKTKIFSIKALNNELIFEELTK